mgnify:CR=1 FL=1
MNKVCRWKKFKDKEINESICQKLEPIIIEEYPWDENGYKPRVEGSRINTPEPDFHRPEFFGDLILV